MNKSLQNIDGIVGANCYTCNSRNENIYYMCNENGSVIADELDSCEAILEVYKDRYEYINNLYAEHMPS